MILAKNANWKLEDIILPRGFISDLSAISVGAARGVLCAKTDNTPLSKYYLPIVMLKDGKDLVIPKEAEQ